MPSSDSVVVHATGLERRFGAARALRGIDLSLRRGEALVVVGPNGSGKSTLLRLLAGLLRPTAGEVHVLGRRLRAGDPEARRPIGLLSHRSLLYDDLTLLENLTFAARLYGLPDPRTAARAALRELGLDRRMDDLPRRLSRGMLQRAAIARALLHEPTLLLLDEPFTGLDAPAASRLRFLLRDRLTADRAMVIVTHQPAEVWDLASRVAVLAGGRWALETVPGPDPAGFAARYQALTDA